MDGSIELAMDGEGGRYHVEGIRSSPVEPAPAARRLRVGDGHGKLATDAPQRETHMAPACLVSPSCVLYDRVV